jgi:hypothetical protein
VLQHLQRLDEALVAGLCALLKRAGDSGPRLLSTAITRDLGDPRLPQALLDRLAVVRVPVPPLRQRPEGVGALAAELIRATALASRCRV